MWSKHSLLDSDIECVGRAFPCIGLDIGGGESAGRGLLVISGKIGQ